MMKWFGAILVLLGSGAVGLLIVAAHKKEEQTLEQLIRILEYMLCELPYRMMPLSELCRNAAQAHSGFIGNVFINLAEELDAQLAPDASACMHSVLVKHDSIPERTYQCLSLVGASLGRFDLAGQLQGLEGTLKQARYQLDNLQRDKAVRYRSYQTLGICAGSALVILLL